MPGAPRDRRSSDPIADELAAINTSLDHLRESAHALRNADTVILLRLDRLESESHEAARSRGDAALSPAGRQLLAVTNGLDERVERIERHVETSEAMLNQGRGALAAMRVLAGGSVLTAVAALLGLAKSLGWW